MVTEELKKYLISELKYYKELLENTDPDEIDETSYVAEQNIPINNKIVEINFIIKGKE